MSAERLRLVRSFAELQAGDLVVLSPCYECGRRHRMMLTVKMPPTFGFDVDGLEMTAPGWLYQPYAPCDGTWGNRNLDCAITPATVDRGALFLVDTGLEASDSSTTSRPLHTRKPVGERAR